MKESLYEPISWHVNSWKSSWHLNSWERYRLMKESLHESISCHVTWLMNPVYDPDIDSWKSLYRVTWHDLWTQSYERVYIMVHIYIRYRLMKETQYRLIVSRDMTYELSLWPRYRLMKESISCHVTRLVNLVSDPWHHCDYEWDPFNHTHVSNPKNLALPLSQMGGLWPWMCVYISISIYTHIHTDVSILGVVDSACVCTYMCIYIYIYVYIHVYVYIYLYAYFSIYMYMYMYMHTYTYIYTYT